MTEDVKICPSCGAEFYAHIEECRECEIALVRPDEIPDEGEPNEADMIEGPVECVAEGEMASIAEQAFTLEEAGIPYMVGKNDLEDPDCETGSCSTSACGPGEIYSLFVPKEMTNKAVTTLSDHLSAAYPETVITNERLEKGLCPACGHKSSAGKAQCPECGLSLVGSESNGGHA